ncbi:MAG TPA: efflux RND transporter periplasmic adaptor subunit [Noviherbaspirillum sp.]|nr:efflux RND transporter periplasmic adaptor subunit [Noviherbaspirillum sp.]
MIPVHRLTPIAALVLMFSLAACGDKKTAAQGPGGGMPPPEVAVVTVTAERLALTTELPGRLEATRVAEVRARVPGIVTQRVFREGSEVKAGELLFRIDPAPFQASLNSAEAALEKAQANLAQANLKAQRYKPLVETSAISKQEYDDAVTAQKQAQADVAAAKAARETARLNLGYATVNAPISGRIGRALVTEGALVGEGEATPLAVVQQLNPIYVNVTQSANEALQLQRAMASGKLQKIGADAAKVTLLTEDGQAYPHPGKLLFSDLTVDQSTGAITLRAEVPNPDRFLLPGMYVRARIEQAVNEQAITVPQQAVQREGSGASVLVVADDGKVATRPVQANVAQGNHWIISEGLKPGERVIVEGFQKVAPGATVKAVPWKAAAPSNASQPQAGQPQAAQPDAAAAKSTAQSEPKPAAK